MRALITAMIAASALFMPVIAHASPEDPFGDDWVAIAVVPGTVGDGGYGNAGNADQATQIATDECQSRNNGTRRCVVVAAIQYGCVAYLTDPHSNSWAGGRGPDKDSAVADAGGKLPADHGPDTIGGAQCSIPLTPP